MNVWSRPFVKPGVACLLVVAIVAVVRPWTIRPIQSEAPKAFDAAGFATSAWPRALEDADRLAVDLATSSEPATASRAWFVRGQGLVTAVDQQSRVGLLRVSLSGDNRAVAIQIGPVIRGTALRDALSFVAFSDFTNQFDFAAAANALNDRVSSDVLAPVPVNQLKGRRVTFVGATARSGGQADGVLEVVPVRLSIVDEVTR